MITLSSIVLLPNVIFAQTMNKNDTYGFSMCHPWFVTGELGYSNYLDMYFSDGQTPVGRFSFGRELGQAGILNFGLEVGIQNGNTMRFRVDIAHTEDFGYVFDVSAKPVMDLLLTVKTNTFSDQVPVFALFKVGPAYQRWIITDRDTIDDRTKVSLEVQAGLGYWVNNRTNISLSYQRIFGSHPNFYVKADAETAYISQIPTQYAVLLGISVQF
ncbi:uncharacterized protein RVIR1_05640 [Candidatus Rickettsiella viridis]|uniref:Outer membrane protein beta-barrel domain-containing protein n=2 Tax=Candidatus Rickettsiella viridis TaxID=676208 RepID=A0A2Z5UTW2_9COXI|nr:uncharacterized protein RVIR1_05640 [Candidatus Rickettsiella viridis]